MSEDLEGFDPNQFASVAAGESVDDHADAEGIETGEETSVGATSTWRDMLLSTGPEQDLREVEDPWNPELGGSTRVYRGISKMVDVDGMPAIVDVIIGMVEFFQTFEGMQSQSESQEETEDML